MEEACLTTPKAAPELRIPNSSKSVDVRIIDTGTLLYLKSGLFWDPELKGFAGVHVPIYCFLISNGDHHIIFDLGIRRDWENYAPKIVSVIKTTTTITRGSDVASILNQDGSDLNIRPTDIKSIIWSHNHFDHVGDPTTFPPTTELLVGPGVRAASWPGYPSNPDGGLLDQDMEGRAVREIHFDQGLKIGGLAAFDFFGDGSFYLLDAPGHAVGHVCGLARTTIDPPTFVLMGADACHHPGVLRPTDYLPLPHKVVSSPLAHYRSSAESPQGPTTCPGAMLQRLTMDQSPNSPFFRLPQNFLFPDHDTATQTVGKIQELDAAENVFVLLAHDRSLREFLPLFPDRINDWKQKELKQGTRWEFCWDFKEALEQSDEGGEKKQELQ